MMKRFYLIVFAFFLVTGLHAQPIGPKPFKLSGELPEGLVTVSKVYLSYMFGGERKSDSSSLSNGKYSFSGLLDEPVLGNLRVVHKVDSSGKLPATNNKRDAAQVFLQPGTITVSSIDSFSNVK